MIELYVVRHGETAWNAEGRIQGHLDSDLTPEGRRQAEAAARLLKDRSIRFLYCSNLGRAMKTAAVLSWHLKIDMIPRRDLRECSWGRWQKRTWDDLRRDYAEQMRQRQEHLYEFRPPEGESYHDAEKRVSSFVREIQQRHPGQTIAVVGHNMVNRVMMKQLLDLSFERSCTLRQHHTEVYRLRLNGREKTYELLKAEKEVPQPEDRL